MKVITKARKLFVIFGALITGGVSVTLVSLAPQLAEATRVAN
jgi:hypothetical protein